MLRKSVVVFGLFFAMLLASPAGAQWNDDDSDSDSGRRSWRRPSPQRPVNGIPEPSAALLFGTGALLVQRRLRRR